MGEVPLSVLELLEAGTDYLAKKGVESPQVNMQWLLAEVLGKSRLEVLLMHDHPVPAPQRDRLRELLRQRAGRRPLEYVLGYREFDGQRLRVNEATLIPRPETEILLETVLPRIVAGAGPVVDVGTGSGALAVSIARHHPEVEVIGLELSEAALEVARTNGEGVANVRFLQSDLLAAFEGDAQLIVANLPYIPTDRIATLSPEVRAEPRGALDGGADGLELIKKLITQATGRTRWLGLEFGDGQAGAVKSLFKSEGFRLTLIERDLRGTERVVLGEPNG
ncbi:MAG: peptide chain release factor N(5)-glutamine methyltransferase [Verrucomicrobiota bacterium]